jgi:hypothetical protein
MLLLFPIKLAGIEKFRPPLRNMAPVPVQGTSTYFPQHIPQYAFPYSAYG